MKSELLLATALGSILLAAESKAQAPQGFYNGGVNTCSLSGPAASPYISTCYGYLNGVPTFFAWQPPGSNKTLNFANGVGSGNNGNLYTGMSIDILGNVYVPTPSGTLYMQGAVSAGGTTGTAGQVLQSTGAGVQWGAGGSGGATALTGAVVGTGTGTIATTFGTFSAGGVLFGNAAVGAAVPGFIAVGTGLSLSTSGTLTAPGGVGTVLDVVCGIGLAGGTITVSGTCSIAAQGADTLFGNPTGGSAVPEAVTLGTFLSFTGTTLNVSGVGTVTSITCNNGLTGGLITTTGVCSLAPINAHSLFGNPSSSSAIGTSVAVGTGLSLSAGGTLNSTGTGTVASVTFNCGLTASTNPIIATGTAFLASIANGDVMANISGSSACAGAVTGSNFLDAAFGSTQGDILYRGASGWAVLAPSATAGLPLAGNGTGANPSYQMIGRHPAYVADSNFTAATATIVVNPHWSWSGTGTITDVYAIVATGTMVIALEDAGTTLTGCGAITVTSSGTDVICTGGNVPTLHDAIQLVIVSATSVTEGYSVQWNEVTPL